MARGKKSQEPQELFHAQILYREWARRFTITQRYLKAIYYYQKSTEHGDANYLWTLLGLSEALKKSGQYNEAADVAEKCMTIDPTHLGAKWTRMEALFDVAEVCQSLVCAHQGAKLRQHFRGAVLLANETIEDCVGSNVPKNTMRLLEPWIRQLTEYRNSLVDKLNDEEDEFEGIDEEQARFSVDDPAARLRKYRKRMDAILADLYLGPTSEEKDFLNELLSSPAIPSANKSGSTKVYKVTQDGLVRLNNQQEALRTRRPVYAIRAKAEAALAPGLKKERAREHEYRKCLVENEAKFLLKQVHEARLQRNYLVFFKMVEQTKERLDSYRPNLLADRQRYLNALYCMVSRAYLDPRNLSQVSGNKINCESLLRRLLGLKGPTSLPRDSDLAWPPNLNVKKDISNCRERLALTNEPLEMLWIYHELCKIFLQIKRFDLARFYAKKTRDLASGTNHEDWMLNAAHIMIRIELAQHNRTEAKEAAMIALESAEKLNVNFLTDFYKRAIDYIDSLNFGHLTDEDSIAARQKVMLQLMMPIDMRLRMELLLRSMDAVPPNRRLSVMPGCKPKTGLNSKKMTVRPTSPPNAEKEERVALLKKYAPSNDIFGFVDFSLYD